ncbi:MAG: hypothetical protein Q4D82_01550 [Neisseria sp.]|nr:hypothetical protein [Neisseria sp.]
MTVKECLFALLLLAWPVAGFFDETAALLAQGFFWLICLYEAAALAMHGKNYDAMQGWTAAYLRAVTAFELAFIVLFIAHGWFWLALLAACCSLYSVCLFYQERV